MVTDIEQKLSQIKGIGPKRLERIKDGLENRKLTWNDLRGMPALSIKTTFDLPINVAQAVADSVSESFVTTGQAAALDDLEPTLASKNIRLLPSDALDYPVRLRRVLATFAPSTLYYWGNLELVNRPAVGFCGSRSASEKGLQVTADVAEQAVQRGWVVVSGHAAGVDTTAHRVALQNGGATIIVAAQGILDFKLRAELKRIARPEQLLILSEFPPKAGWNVGYAMKRNRTIIGLSDAMVLIEARSEGGTFEAGKQALALKMPLFVAEYETPAQSASGNSYFLAQGAMALRRKRETGRANIDVLCQAVEQAEMS